MLSRCAQLGAPTGGAPDDEPPKIVKSNPSNESVNFAGDHISITFDEYVQLNDIKNQLIISPTLENKPEITLKKKTLTVRFQDELKPNTTYSLNFGEGVKDYNAGNILRNFIMAFSTGSALDSLSIGGMVMDAKSTLPKENVKVMLYDSPEDSLPRTTKPLYFAQTDKTGAFQIKYLPKGNYKLFALEELDGNFLYDNPEENIAFSKALLDLKPMQETYDSLSLLLFNEENDLGYITKETTDSLGMYKIDFSIPQKNMTVNQFVNGDSILIDHYLTEEKDTLFYFLNDESEVYVHRYDDRFPDRTHLIDTIGLIPIDTSEVYTKEKGLILKGQEKRQLIKGQKMFFSSSKPIESIDRNYVAVKIADSIEVNDFKVNKRDQFGLTMELSLEENQSYAIYFYPQAVRSEYGSLMDTMRFQYSVSDIRELGELSLTVKLPMENPVIILKNAVGKQIRSVSLDSTRKVLFSDIFPSKLDIYCFDDVNGDGTWTAGDYDLKSPPEQMYKFPKKVEIRSNWSQEFIWE